ncbi:DUF4249 domain-containing protein [Maribacter sp. 2210JD10-5]|uniref:DUF4249 domain-containing protein n=1 Tax=Maribacter sp. 2210JD10-5 TaxID=3386272 RepID=UPI0039BCEED7
MTNLARLLLYLLLSFILTHATSCEETVELDLDSSKERLVIEGLIKWEKGTSGQEQRIRLKKVAPFYEGRLTPAIGATVRVENSEGNVFAFEEANDGDYFTDSFVPEIGESYTLTVVYDGETYTASEQLIAAPEIDEVNQSTDKGFSQDNPEISVFFTDMENVENYYRVNYRRTRRAEGAIVSIIFENFVFSDEFQDGNQILNFYEEEDEDDFSKDDQFEVTLYGISEAFYNYLDILEDQDDEGGPFVIPPVNVKGNCNNSTNPENYPYGYFALSEFNSQDYTFE